MTVLVRVAPYSISEYTSLVYAGLYELAATGEIELVLDHSILQTASRKPPHFATALLQVEANGSGETKRLAFDFVDGAGVASPELLDTVDIYFKRSFRTSAVNTLPSPARERVRPFGLHYACTSEQQSLRQRWSHLREHDRVHCSFGGSSTEPPSVGAHLKSTISLALAKYWKVRCPSTMPPLISEFECSPTAAAEPVIFYRTRVYPPTQRNSERGMVENENRVAVIRALKKEFGTRFVGGLRDSAFAQKHYPDCIFPADINWRQHVSLLKKYLIAVTTAGLYDSTDWKLAEYLAASRCTVTERLRYELPNPLTDGTELMAFDTPDQCVAACDQILRDSALASTLRENANRYYQAYLAPDQAMRIVLNLPVGR